MSWPSTWLVANGATVADGELMLLHQGAAAFTLWTGRPAPLDVMRAALATARAGGVRSAEGEPAGEVAAAPQAELATADTGGGSGSGSAAT